MAAYVAIRDSYGANCAYYVKGKTYSFDKDPGEHFELAGKAPAPVAEPDLPVPASYHAMTIAELAAIADEKGIKISVKWNKDKIIQALLAVPEELQ